jgi:prefoldin subunit 5
LAHEGKDIVKRRSIGVLVAATLFLGACDNQLSAESLARERQALQREVNALRAEAESLRAANDELMSQLATITVLLETQREELRSRLDAFERSAERVQARASELGRTIEGAQSATEDAQRVADRALEQAAREELEGALEARRQAPETDPAMGQPEMSEPAEGTAAPAETAPIPSAPATPEPVEQPGGSH